MEDSRNMGFSHSSCTSRRRTEFQKKIEHVSIPIGCSAKIAITGPDKNDKNVTELMWVRIEEILPESKYRGLLMNDPFNIINIKYEDIVLFNRSEIIDIC
jgi:uncharacterized protein YegJ (DUF2314 family)